MLHVLRLISKVHVTMGMFMGIRLKYRNRQKDELIILLNFVPRISSFKVLIKVSW